MNPRAWAFCSFIAATLLASATLALAASLSPSGLGQLKSSSAPSWIALSVYGRPSPRIEPPLVSASSLDSENLEKILVPLERAVTHTKENVVAKNLGHYETNGARIFFNPGIVLVKRPGDLHVSALRTDAGSEQHAVAALRGRSDVQFAELDTIQTRQFTPSDPNLGFQWHHQTIKSFDAWKHGLGTHDVTVAIVDTPFQMNHPDLIDNVAAGWDVTDQMPILTDSGDPHATASAGMAAAVINNRIGVAGAANCRLVPIGINGATSEMYDAIIWAADHGIRVVNISWTGGGDDALEIAGQYLEQKTQGILVMPGLNGIGRMNLPNQPHIICVAMTDSADNARSISGPHIDFAAPGWEVYTTSTNGMYATVSGTSFASPLFAGIAAAVMSINPVLTAEQVVGVLQASADDKGNSGWDESYGWGRVNFGAAIEETLKSLPTILSISKDSSQIQLSVRTTFPATLALERSVGGGTFSWFQVAATNTSDQVTFFADDPASGPAFYRVRAQAVPQ